MTISKVIYPLLKRQTLLECKVLSSAMYVRLKTNKAITRSTRSELDTNVKPLGEKVKETTKTASYLGIILLGVGVTGTLFYAVFNELFSSKSPNNIYSKAVNKCKEDPRVQDKLGLPISAYGEETRRGRRRHVAHAIYEKNGKKYLRMKFYLKGAFCIGTVQLEMVENSAGDYEYRYLFVDANDLLQSTIVLVDNRASETPSTLPGLTFV